MDISYNHKANYFLNLFNFILNYLLILYFKIYIRPIAHPSNHEPFEKNVPKKKVIESDNYEFCFRLVFANAIKNFAVVGIKIKPI